jgi:hypothetical protein
MFIGWNLCAVFEGVEMQEFLSLISLINQMMPLILEAVETVEKMFPQGGQGTLKLELVKGYIQEAANATNAAIAQLPAFVNVLTPVISGIVALANSTGLFKKG